MVVTGGSAGLGRAIAAAFARGGDRVALIARGTERLAEAATEIELLGSPSLALSADVADPEQVEGAAARVESEWGPIDLWINNAMTTVFAPFEQILPEEFRRATEVTYLGAVFGTLAALRRMKPRNRGTIVQIGSALAYRAIPLQSAYCGAKHALHGFTQSLRCELLHDRSAVRLIEVHMPALNTPQFEWCRTRLPHRPQPVPPIFQPEVAARAVVWAVEQDRKETYVAAPTVGAIVLNKLVPGLLDRYLARSAYQGQQTDELADPGRPSNLFEPVPGRFGSHGRFDERAHDRSLQVWLNRRRRWVLGTLAAAVAAGAGLWTLLS